MTDAILTKIADGVLTITFNRPEKKNAITAKMYEKMADALCAAQTDNTIRIILFTGHPDVFTAGNDLDDFLKNSIASITPWSNDAGTKNIPVVRFMQALSSAEKPIIAAVAGNAIGIGTTMLLHCDLVYLAENAKLSLPFTQLGLCPEFGSSFLLQRLAGYQRAAEKLMLGEPFGAQEALHMGLANKVLPNHELLTYANAQAARLTALPAASLRATKQLMKEGQAAALNKQMADEFTQFAAMLSAPEAKEAFTAFFQKRPPNFEQFS